MTKQDTRRTMEVNKKTTSLSLDNDEFPEIEKTVWQTQRNRRKCSNFTKEAE